MVKVALNTMVAPETLEAIRGMATGRSQGQVVDEAIAAIQGGDKHGEVNRWFRETWTRLDEIFEMLQSGEPEDWAQGRNTIERARLLIAQSDPAAIPGVSRGPVGQFPCRCVHSGCRGAKFQGASRFANLCPACSESGHAGEPRSCQSCFDDTGPT